MEDESKVTVAELNRYHLFGDEREREKVRKNISVEWLSSMSVCKPGERRQPLCLVLGRDVRGALRKRC